MGLNNIATLARVIVNRQGGGRCREKSNCAGGAYSTNVFLQKQNAFQQILAGAILCSAIPLIRAEPPIAQDTTSPNVFWLSSDTFYVDEDETNAVITVEFAPGDRSWTGWVNYSATDGTANDGEDFSEVSGTLYFSGPGPSQQIIVPIHKDDKREGSETVRIFLSNTNAILTRSNATLVIIDKNQNPQLRITSGANNCLNLEWPTNYSDFVLEKSADCLGANWSIVSSPQSISNGFCRVTESCTSPPQFYRLKKTPAP